MSDKENLKQLSDIKVDRGELMEICTICYELWWDEFLDVQTNDIDANGMIEEVNWDDDDEVDGVLQGLIDGASDISFFEEKKRFNGREYDAGRLLGVCKVLPDKYRSYMATIVDDYVIDEKYKHNLGEILAFLKPEETGVEVF